MSCPERPHHGEPYPAWTSWHSEHVTTDPWSPPRIDRPPAATDPLQPPWPRGARKTIRQTSPTIYHPERRAMKSGLIRSVVTILNPRQPLKPGTWTISCQAPEIHSNNAILNLRLAITLRWKAEVMLRVTPARRNRSFQNANVKIVSRLETMEHGIPWTRTMESKKARDTVAAQYG